MPSHLHGPRTLALIAVFKFFKSALLIAAAIALFHLRRPEVNAELVAWLRTFPITTGHELLAPVIRWVLGINAHTVELLDAIALTYAGLYAVEGVGLWRNAKWAEYLTAISTSLFIPVEIWEIIAHFGALKLLTLIANIAIVVYLVHLLRLRHLAESRATDPLRSGSMP